jgi:hypothetical protein
LKATTKMYAIVLLTILLAGSVFYWYGNGTLYRATNGAFGEPKSTVLGQNGPVLSPCGTGTQWDATQQKCVASALNVGGACNPNTAVFEAATEMGVHDGLTMAALSSTTNVYIFNAGMTSRVDTVAVAATLSVGTAHLSPGTPYVFQVESTAGNGYYPSYYALHQGWTDCSDLFYWEAGMGATQYITPHGPSHTNPSTPMGQVYEVPIGKVHWSPGTTNYWSFGSDQFNIFQREAAASVKFRVDSPTVASKHTATGAVATTGTIFSGTLASDYSATAQKWDANLNIKLADLDEVYGYPMIYFDQVHTRKIGYLAVWLSFNNTNIVSQSITGSPTGAWSQMSPGITPGYSNFVQFLPPVESTQTKYGNLDVDIPVDTGSLNGLSTVIGAAMWVADVQSQAILTSTGADSFPTVYSPITTSYGLTATVYATGFATSSNKPTTALTYLVFLS